MKQTIRAFEDRTPLSELPKELQDILIENDLLAPGNNLTSYCGLLVSGSTVNVFFPRSTAANSDPEDVTELASDLLKALIRYSSSQRYGGEADESPRLNSGLSLQISILKDYLSNGLYSRRIKRETTNTGKPDWRKTIRKNVSYPSGENQIFLSFQGTQKIHESKSVISMIHAYWIDKLGKRFGWILGEDKTFNNAFPNTVETSHEYQLHQLRNELSLVYADRDMWLLKQLIKLIADETQEDGNNLFFYGIKNFHHAWENMLGEVLEWKISLNQLLPVPAYQREDGQIHIAARKGQRADIFLKHPHTNDYCIIDAKYYASDTVPNLPGWPDLVKQFFYEKALSSVFPSSTVHNCFIFPERNGQYKSVHMTNRVADELLDSEYAPIKIAYADPRDVVSYYSKRKKITDFSNSLMKI